MKNRYRYIIAIILIVVGFLFFVLNDSSKEEKEVRVFYPQAKKVTLIKNIADDLYGSLYFPAVKRAYEVDGEICAYVVSCVGYNGPIEVLAAIDNKKDKLIGIQILNHEESMDYAEHIEKNWFLDRFKNLPVNKYLNMVVLDKENPEDIVQVTGATVSSQAVVSAVNAAIGHYQYWNYSIQLPKVPDVVPQEMWQKDINSFAINWEGGSVRIDTDEIKEYEQIEMDTTLINTTGTETKLRVTGPTLRHVLDMEGIDLSEYEGIGITGRDGYYTMIDKEKLEVNDIILTWKVNGKDIKDEDKPVRVSVPLELGPYWVKMVSNIDLYKEISPKDIDSVHMFNPLTEDIEPYYYEYYGAKDKSIEVGKILRKFDEVDEKGFFTMGAVDGLIKNETISLVRQRYFLKVEGDNAPMNIAPNFKLGMNVKEMTHFSTTKDAVIFPEKIIEVVRTKSIYGNEGMLLEDVLLTAGMRWDEVDNFTAVKTDETTIDLSLEDLLKCYLIYEDKSVILYKGNSEIMRSLLRIEKNEI
ncbi:FMN-binding protein [Sedimentibacter sp. MB31-C6]|uniref:FMN-binding protein n=1 Tax=Sedimentibacter sp. MB31-C6 TaxID=3109366 RepID=UPI002DDD706C|nr:FMN-binding protein [Sedimentibacter sp. MB36-C1]WSI02922.1 FMN-binding protein [Sedimentibacter sp. MB36-C1]